MLLPPPGLIVIMTLLFSYRFAPLWQLELLTTCLQRFWGQLREAEAEATVLNVTGGLWVSVPMRCCWVPRPSMLSLSLKLMPKSSISRYTSNIFQAIPTKSQAFHIKNRGWCNGEQVTVVSLIPGVKSQPVVPGDLLLYGAYKAFKQVVSPQDYFEFPSSGPEISEKARSLIIGLISEREDRLGRKSLGDFRSHPFFSGLDWASLHKVPAPFLPEVSNPTDTSNFDIMDDCLSETVFHCQTLGLAATHVDYV